MSSGASLEARVDDIGSDQNDSDPDFNEPERKPEMPVIVRLTEYGFEESTWQYYAARAAVGSLSERPSEPSEYVVGKMFDEMPRDYKKGKLKEAEEKLHEILRKLMDEQVLCIMKELKEKDVSLRWRKLRRGKNYDSVARGEGISFYTDVLDIR